jgi:hypothetical protein
MIKVEGSTICLFHCTFCTIYIIKMLMLSGVAEDVITCPSCNSTIVIEVDEVTLPSYCRNDQREKQSFAIGDGPLSSGFNSSPSQSSIGMQYVTLELNIHTFGRLQSFRI